MNIYLFLRNVATQGAVGYGQAPGTIATLMTIPVVWFLGSFDLMLSTYVIVSLVLFCLGWFVAQHALPFFDESDPPMIVIDEMVSFIALFIGLPINFKTIFIGFVVFRLLDIFKPLGIRFFDQMPGVAGVMLDDLAAAVYTNICLHILIYFLVI